MFMNGEWGTVCDDFFGMVEANVACMTLGFTRYANYLKKKKKFIFVLLENQKRIFFNLTDENKYFLKYPNESGYTVQYFCLS